MARKRRSTAWLAGALLPAAFLSLTAIADEEDKLKFVWQQDSETGLMMAQLTDSRANSDTDYYGLYYHQDSLSTDGRYLVYRTIQANAAGTALDADTRVYHRLDLLTGQTIPLTVADQASEALVRGDYVYLYHREHSQSPVNTIVRYLLANPFQEVDPTVFYAGPNTTLLGNMAISLDARYLLFQTSTYVGLLELDSNGDVVGSATVLTGSDEIFQHFHFSPTDPGLFTFVEQDDDNGPDLRLERIHIGRAFHDSGGGLQVLTQALEAADPADPLAGYVYPHPFWGLDGRLWSDGIESAVATEAFIPLAVDSDPAGNFAQVGPSPLLEMALDQWQLHLSTSRALNWYAGDGERSDIPLGEPYFHLVRLDDSDCLPGPVSAPCGEVEQIRLSKSLGAELQRGGNWEANAKVLLTLDGVVMAAPWSFNEPSGLHPIIVTQPDPHHKGQFYENRARNLFLIKLPNRLKARLYDAIQDQLVEGPWKAGHRIAVDAGGLWSMDYAGPGGFGDGVADQTVQGTVGQHYSFADINGDDVDDRVTWIPRPIGAGWIAEVSYSAYDGTLGTGVDSTHEYPAHRIPRPVVGDLDGYGADDLALVYPSWTGLEWLGYLNTQASLPEAKSPSPGYSSSIFGDAVRTEHLFLADINGDGYADRVVVERFFDTWSWFVDFSTESGFGDGVADSSLEFFGYPSWDHPVIGDVNSDGKADLVVAQGFAGQSMKWKAYLSDENGFSLTEMVLSTADFGVRGDHAMIGHLARFHEGGAASSD